MLMLKCHTKGVEQIPETPCKVQIFVKLICYLANYCRSLWVKLFFQLSFQQAVSSIWGVKSRVLASCFELCRCTWWSSSSRSGKKEKLILCYSPLSGVESGPCRIFTWTPRNTSKESLCISILYLRKVTLHTSLEVYFKFFFLRLIQEKSRYMLPKLYLYYN